MATTGLTHAEVRITVTTEDGDHSESCHRCPAHGGDDPLVFALVQALMHASIGNTLLTLAEAVIEVAEDELGGDTEYAGCRDALLFAAQAYQKYCQDRTERMIAGGLLDAAQKLRRDYDQNGI